MLNRTEKQPSQFIAYVTMIKYLWKRSIMDFGNKFVGYFISTGLFLLVYGCVIGDLIGTVQGVPFIAFCLPGVITNVIMNVANNDGSIEFYLLKYDNSIIMCLCFYK